MPQRVSMPIVLIHRGLANSASLFLVFLTVWALVQFFRSRPLGPSWNGAAIVAEVLLLAQFAVGGILWLQGLQAGPRPWIHVSVRHGRHHHAAGGLFVFRQARRQQNPGAGDDACLCLPMGHRAACRSSDHAAGPLLAPTCTGPIPRLCHPHPPAVQPTLRAAQTAWTACPVTRVCFDFLCCAC